MWFSKKNTILCVLLICSVLLFLSNQLFAIDKGNDDCTIIDGKLEDCSYYSVNGDFSIPSSGFSIINSSVDFNDVKLISSGSMNLINNSYLYIYNTFDLNGKNVIINLQDYSAIFFQSNIINSSETPSNIKITVDYSSYGSLIPVKIYFVDTGIYALNAINIYHSDSGNKEHVLIKCDDVKCWSLQDLQISADQALTIKIDVHSQALNDIDFRIGSLISDNDQVINIIFDDAILNSITFASDVDQILNNQLNITQMNLIELHNTPGNNLILEDGLQFKKYVIDGKLLINDNDVTVNNIEGAGEVDITVNNPIIVDQAISINNIDFNGTLASNFNVNVSGNINIHELILTQNATLNVATDVNQVAFEQITLENTSKINFENASVEVQLNDLNLGLDTSIENTNGSLSLIFGANNMSIDVKGTVVAKDDLILDFSSLTTEPQELYYLNIISANHYMQKNANLDITTLDTNNITLDNNAQLEIQNLTNNKLASITLAPETYLNFRIPVEVSQIDNQGNIESDNMFTLVGQSGVTNINLGKLSSKSLVIDGVSSATVQADQLIVDTSVNLTSSDLVANAILQNQLSNADFKVENASLTVNDEININNINVIHSNANLNLVKVKNDFIISDNDINNTITISEVNANNLHIQNSININIDSIFNVNKVQIDNSSAININNIGIRDNISKIAEFDVQSSDIMMNTIANNVMEASFTNSDVQATLVASDILNITNTQVGIETIDSKNEVTLKDHTKGNIGTIHTAELYINTIDALLIDNQLDVNFLSAEDSTLIVNQNQLLVADDVYAIKANEMLLNNTSIEVYGDILSDNHISLTNNAMLSFGGDIQVKNLIELDSSKLQLLAGSSSVLQAVNLNLINNSVLNADKLIIDAFQVTNSTIDHANSLILAGKLNVNESTLVIDIVTIKNSNTIIDIDNQSTITFDTVQAMPDKDDNVILKGSIVMKDNVSLTANNLAILELNLNQSTLDAQLTTADSLTATNSDITFQNDTIINNIVINDTSLSQNNTLQVMNFTINDSKNITLNTVEAGVRLESNNSEIIADAITTNLLTMNNSLLTINTMLTTNKVNINDNSQLLVAGDLVVNDALANADIIINNSQVSVYGDVILGVPLKAKSSELNFGKKGADINANINTLSLTGNTFLYIFGYVNADTIMVTDSNDALNYGVAINLDNDIPDDHTLIKHLVLKNANVFVNDLIANELLFDDNSQLTTTNLVVNGKSSLINSSLLATNVTIYDQLTVNHSAINTDNSIIDADHLIIHGVLYTEGAVKIDIDNIDGVVIGDNEMLGDIKINATTKEQSAEIINKNIHINNFELYYTSLITEELILENNLVAEHADIKAKQINAKNATFINTSLDVSGIITVSDTLIFDQSNNLEFNKSVNAGNTVLYDTTLQVNQNVTITSDTMNLVNSEIVLFDDTSILDVNDLSLNNSTIVGLKGMLSVDSLVMKNVDIFEVDSIEVINLNLDNSELLYTTEASNQIDNLVLNNSVLSGVGSVSINDVSMINYSELNNISQVNIEHSLFIADSVLDVQIVDINNADITVDITNNADRELNSGIDSNVVYIDNSAINVLLSNTYNITYHARANNDYGYTEYGLMRADNIQLTSVDYNIDLPNWFEYKIYEDRDYINNKDLLIVGINRKYHYAEMVLVSDYAYDTHLLALASNIDTAADDQVNSDILSNIVTNLDYASDVCNPSQGYDVSCNSVAQNIMSLKPISNDILVKDLYLKSKALADIVFDQQNVFFANSEYSSVIDSLFQENEFGNDKNMIEQNAIWVKDVMNFGHTDQVIVGNELQSDASSYMNNALIVGYNIIDEYSNDLTNALLVSVFSGVETGLLAVEDDNLTNHPSASAVSLGGVLGVSVLKMRNKFFIQLQGMNYADFYISKRKDFMDSVNSSNMLVNEILFEGKVGREFNANFIREYFIYKPMFYVNNSITYGLRASETGGQSSFKRESYQGQVMEYGFSQSIYDLYTFGSAFMIPYMNFDIFSRTYNMPATVLLFADLPSDQYATTFDEYSLQDNGYGVRLGVNYIYNQMNVNFGYHIENTTYGVQNSAFLQISYILN